MPGISALTGAVVPQKPVKGFGRPSGGVEAESPQNASDGLTAASASKVEQRRLLIYKVDNAGRNHVWLHARDTESGEKLRIRLMGHRPYFYAEEEAASLQHVSIIDRETGHRSFTGTPLVKLTTTVPGEVRKLRKLVDQPHEADVPYTRRCIVDSQAWGVCDVGVIHVQRDEYATRPELIVPVTREVHEPLDVVYFDIEGGNVHDVEKARDEVYCIGAYDRRDGRWLMWSYHPTKDVGIDSVETNRHGTVDLELHHFADREGEDGEREMLRSFIEWLRERAPDVLAGWYSNDYDVPYLINRASRKGIPRSTWGRWGIVDADWTNIPGIHPLDLLGVHKYALYGGYQDNTLQNVVEKLCGVVIEKDHRSIRDWWLNDPEHLFRYNVQDVEATFLIDDAQDYSGFAQGLMFLTFCDTMQAITMATVWGDGLFLRRAQDRGEVLPMKREGEDWKSGGAYVLPPKPGFYQSVAGVDYSSLYPSIIVSCNISYETLVDAEDVRSGTVPRSTVYSVPDLDDAASMVRGPLYFDTTRKGLLPEVTEELWEVKDRYDRLMKEARAQGDEAMERRYATLRSAAKIAVNSCYGLANSGKSRIGRIETGEATTATGRHVTKLTRDTLVGMGKTVVGGDTDSNYFLLDEGSWEDQARYAVETVVSTVQKDMGERGAIRTELFDLEWEKVYDPMLVTSKKKLYAGRVVMKDGVMLDDRYLEVKGLYMVRSDASDYTVEVMEEALKKLLLRGEDADSVHDYVNRAYAEVLNGRVRHSRVASRKSLKRDIQTYRKDGGWTYYVAEAAHYANENLDASFSRGDRPFVVKLVPGSDEDPTYLALEEGEDIPEGFRVDWQHHADLAVKSKMRRIYEAMGMEGSLRGFGNRTLAEWFDDGGDGGGAGMTLRDWF